MAPKAADSAQRQYLFSALVDRPSLVPQCAALLNAEWPRSESARLVSLERSTQNRPPMSLVLEETVGGRLLAHIKLCDIPGRPHDCWVESVVVNKRLRGQGLGRRAMEETEKLARTFGFSTIYLSTHDQHAFYSRCGYENCAPIVNVGGNSHLFKDPRFAAFQQNLMTAATENANSGSCISSKEDTFKTVVEHRHGSLSSGREPTSLPTSGEDLLTASPAHTVPPPPPPLPPTLQSKDILKSSIHRTTNVQYMRRHIDV